MNMFATFNVGDLTPYIEDKDECIEYLRANPLQMGDKVRCGASYKIQPPNHIKAWFELGRWGIMRMGLKDLVCLSPY